MGVERILLPGARLVARVGGWAGDAVLGHLLLRCVAPSWVLRSTPPAARRLAWAGEAVVVYGRRPRHRDGLARALALYANALHGSGRHEEAITAAEQSLGVAGARRSPTQIGYTLHIRALALSESARFSTALKAAAESVSAYRGAVPQRRDRPLGSAVKPLYTYGQTLEQLGRAADAVAAYQECAGLLRDMPLRQWLVRFRLETPVLTDLARGLRDLGRFDEAIEAGAKAREWTDPPAIRLYPRFLPYRAQLLIDLAWCRGATGGPAAARDAAEEAVTVCRTLIGRDRAAGEFGLVLALECLSHHLGELAVPAEESAALEELAELCTRLAEDDPDAYAPQLATVLGELAARRWADGARQEAVELTGKSVDAYRRAAGLDPRSHEPGLARALSDLGIRQYDTGSADAAVRSGREALAITRRLFGAAPDTYRPRMARRLRILARALRLAGDEAEASACDDEASSIEGGATAGAERNP